METKDTAIEIHKYYMDFFKVNYEGISIPKDIQKDMLKEVAFMIDTN